MVFQLPKQDIKHLSISTTVGRGDWYKGNKYDISMHKYQSFETEWKA